MNQFIRTLALMSFAGISTFAAGQATLAEAYEARPAISCFNSQDDYPGDYVVMDTGVRNQSWGPLGRARALHCPIPNTGSTLSSAWLTGFDGNNETGFDGNILVKTCSTPWNGGGADCSGFQAIGGLSTTHTGIVSTGIDSSLMGHLNNGGNVHRVMVVSLPRNGVLGNSSLTGYEVF